MTLDNAPWGMRGMAVAPHSLAAESAIGVLRDGGNAIEAMVAAAAAIAVVYPHMNSIGGDAFWLIHVPGESPRAIDACGAAGSRASVDLYRSQGHATIPFRGGIAANTVAGTLSGWSLALEYSREGLGGKLPLSRLLADAIHYARHGIPVTRSQHATTAAKLDGLREQPGFAETFTVNGEVPRFGSLFVQPRMAATLQQLAAAAGCRRCRANARVRAACATARGGCASRRRPAGCHTQRGRGRSSVRDHRDRNRRDPPPTQGLVSLLLLGILDALDIGATAPAGADYVHLSVEAVKQAFGVRDRREHLLRVRRHVGGIGDVPVAVDARG